MLRLQHIIRHPTASSSLRAFCTPPSNNDSKNKLENPNKPLNDNNPRNEVNPIQRTFNILGNDLKKVKNFFSSSTKSSETASDFSQPGEEGISKNSKETPLQKIQRETTRRSYSDEEFQTHCDVLVIGGGGVGSSVAYWLKRQARNGLNVVVVERDNTVSD